MFIPTVIECLLLYDLVGNHCFAELAQYSSSTRNNKYLRNNLVNRIGRSSVQIYTIHHGERITYICLKEPNLSDHTSPNKRSLVSNSRSRQITATTRLSIYNPTTRVIASETQLSESLIYACEASFRHNITRDLKIRTAKL